MERLILLRHAKAVPESDAPEDRARVLSPRGRADAIDAGAALAEQGMRPDKAIVSTAARTNETWEIVGPMLGNPPVEFRDALYMADADTIWAEAVRGKADKVLIVGHNPGLYDLAAQLIEQARDRSKLARMISDGMSPASWAAFSTSGDALKAAGASVIGGWSPKSS
mgnify:CR=1 FL=1